MPDLRPFKEQETIPVVVYDRVGNLAMGVAGVGDIRVRIVAGSGGGLSQQDNSAFTTGTDSMVPAGGLYEASPSAVTSGRAALIGIGTLRALRTIHETKGGLDISDEATSSIKVNVVAGGAGGGLSQIQVRNLADSAYADVGLHASDLRLPVALYTAAGAAMLGQAAKAASIPVAIASDQDALPVTGTFWQATQPVSIAATVTVDSELTTSDLDTGAGTATRAVVGLLNAESGGPTLVGSANPLPVTGPLTDTQLRALAVPVSGTVTIGTFPDNEPFNMAQLAGTATSVNSGNRDNGTQRVVLATDQPALANKLLVTPDLPSGASTAAKQPALGTAGAASADVITIQGIASMTKLLVTPDSVALPANQSVNVAQVAGGTTGLAGAGNAGANTLRVVIATDQLTIPVSATDAGSGKTLKRAPISLTATGDVVAAVATKRLKVFSCVIQSLTDGMTVQLRNKTTTGTVLTPAYSLNAREGIVESAINPPAFLFASIAGEAIEALITGTGTIKIAVSYWDDDVS